MLTFDEPSHIYRWNGAIVPSVTQILKPLSNFDGIPAAVLEAKRDLGSRVHAAAQYLDEDDLDESSIEDDVRGYLTGYRRFLADSGAKVLLNEQRLYEPTMRYCGTLDRVMLFDGWKWLVDLKTSIATPISTGAQTAAYLRALNDPGVTHRAALRLRPDGTYRFDPLTGADDWAVFVACLSIHRYKGRHIS